MKKFIALLLAAGGLLALAACVPAETAPPAQEPMDAVIAESGIETPAPVPDPALAEAEHQHGPDTDDNVVEHDIPGYCGNTVTTVSFHPMGEDGTGWSKSVMGSASVALTDLLRYLDYADEICKCLPEYTVETEFGTYGVSLGGYARCGQTQTALTQQQLDELGTLMDAIAAVEDGGFAD